jgi:hypothetical protein
MRTATMTGEHIWGKWLVKALGPHKYNLRRVDHDAAGQPKISGQWRSRSVDVKAHEVCEECNNQWMSDLENQTKAVAKEMIVSGGSVSLPPSGVATLAAFAFKTAVIFDHMNIRSANRPFPGTFFSPKTRQRFRESLELPEGVHIWLARFVSKAAAAGRSRSDYFKYKAGPWKDFSFFTVTYAVGYLIFQVVCSRWAKVSPRSQPFPVVIQHSKWNAASVLLWPNQGLPVSWPPPQHFSDDTIDAFCNRW